MTAITDAERRKGRLDQWLWFARFVKSRSLAARLCAAGLVVVNGAAVRKPSHTIRIGDIVVVPRGRFQHTARITAIGSRRGPASEARQLYQETQEPASLGEIGPQWLPLLDEAIDLDYRAPQILPGPMSR